ncbi:hypothetical protein ACJRO7_020531 [Eucalyptus globulus]|uniref:Uncharacterized protein n=1 Tax=Eucalyptus globulus TaxID=34317 RepID=A0ABD3KN27_EUCGL
MSVLRYPDAFEASELQVWNNAAFDNGESEDSAAVAATQGKPEPRVHQFPVSFKSSVPSKIQWKQGVLEPLSAKAIDREGNGRTIDAEIEEVEKEIMRLSSRLKALRLEKAKVGDKKKPRRRVVSAKFKEPKQVVGIGRNLDAAKRIEETPLSSAKRSLNRRGLSLGLAEIASSASKSRPSIKGEITLGLSIQNWRKSCF